MQTCVSLFFLFFYLCSRTARRYRDQARQARSRHFCHAKVARQATDEKPLPMLGL